MSHAKPSAQRRKIGGVQSRRPRRIRHAGLTLVELLFAVVVFIAAGLGILMAYQSAFELSEVAQQTSMAVNDLHDMMEKIKDTSFGAIPTTFPAGVVGGSGGNPVVTATYGGIIGGYSLTQERVTVTYPSPVPDPLEIVVTLSWLNGARTYTRSLSTMRSSGTI